MQYLLRLDEQLFLIINHLPHNIFLDTLFGFITLVGYFGGIWIVISLFLYFKNKIKYKKLVVSMLTVDVITIMIGEWFLKNIIARPRPQIEIPATIVPFNFYHSFSFPSGHATIAFAAAYILGREQKKLKWFYFSLATLISFSRIYLGKHYPSDVFAGVLIGLLIGFGSYKLVNKFTIKPTKSQL